MTEPTTPSDLELPGLDGANPLGFLTALGTFALTAEIVPGVSMAWRSTASGWRPALCDAGLTQDEFVEALHTAIHNASMDAFDIDDKLPFKAETLKEVLRTHAEAAAPNRRRVIDFLAAFGCEVHKEKNEDFQGTRFRMVRSGDSAGQGLPVYVKKMREQLSVDHLQRTLFRAWDYQDEGFSLRWDPLEDQRYALRWRNPSKSNLQDGPGTMLAANYLAVEALRLYPTQPQVNHTATTGFHRNDRRQIHFSWPLWETPIPLDVCASLLAQADWHPPSIDTPAQQAMGVTAVYRSQRIQQNQYYSNFTPARPM